MSQDLTPEDHALLVALAALEPGAGPAGPRVAPSAAAPAAPADGGAGDEARETLVRLNFEVRGLLPAALSPIAPRPQVKRRLMAAIAAATAPPAAAGAPQPPRRSEPLIFPRRAGEPGEPHAGTPEAPSEAAAPAIPPAPATPPAAPVPSGPAMPLGPLAGPAPVTPSASGKHAADAPAMAPAADEPATPPAARAAGADRAAGRPVWLGRLAAALILALLGTSGWLLRSSLEQGEAIARMRGERDAARRQVDELEARLGRLTAEAGNLRQDFSIVTSPAVEVCALQPTAPAGPEMAGAHGVMFVAADHQHWYMSLRGLRPAAAGKVYQLWFLADSGPVSAGTFTAAAGAPWELASDHMPSGTREVRITLEDGAGSPAPHGPEMLRSAAAFRVL